MWISCVKFWFGLVVEEKGEDLINGAPSLDSKFCILILGVLCRWL